MMKQEILNLIDSIENRFEEISQDQAKQIKQLEQEMHNLLEENKQLKLKNMRTLDQIKDYIEELEKIRNHYVSSNN